MPEWKGRVPLTRSHCERITRRLGLHLSVVFNTLRPDEYDCLHFPEEVPGCFGYESSDARAAARAFYKRSIKVISDDESEAGDNKRRPRVRPAKTAPGRRLSTRRRVVSAPAAGRRNAANCRDRPYRRENRPNASDISTQMVSY
ncbi:hypothetical protein EVAR_96977_1 [Eumeta japonica]|uniref:Uncharacterized protein n=1 Tax=Eumeta variegata TaxID=151549 RepID=A0A4C1VEE9_EUMVA|nr:hypothetical protein EVAR_96977_1 [Eumeta japonica]